MRRLYLVSYDINVEDPRRLRRVFQTVRGYGDRLQASVFRCELTGREKFELMEKLQKIVDHSADQVLFIPLGPAGGESESNIEALGRAYVPLDRTSIVV